MNFVLGDWARCRRDSDRLDASCTGWHMATKRANAMGSSDLNGGYEMWRRFLRVWGIRAKAGARK